MTEHDYTRATLATCRYAPCMETFLVREGSPQCYGYCSDACLEASGAMSRESLARAFDDGMCADDPVKPEMADVVDPFNFDNGCQRCYGLGWIAGLSGVRMRCPKCLVAGRPVAPLVAAGQGETDEDAHAEALSFTAWCALWIGCLIGLLCLAAAAAWGWV